MENDKILIESTQKGDINSFRELILIYESDIYNLAFYFTRNEHDASDLYQETWIKVYDNIKKYNSNFKFTSWVFRILRNIYIDKYFRKASEKYEVPIFDSDEKSSKLGLLDELVKKENQKLLDDAINSLTEEYRITLVLIDIQRFSYEEASIIIKR